ncbi:hypothetical protein MMC17_001959 [Xylographa soralifera]|nr:hypothetical protein [Xylographa soralifera]
MRLPLLFTAVLVFGPSSAWTSAIDERPSSPRFVEGSRVFRSGVKVKILDTEDHLDEGQSTCSTEHKNVNDQFPVFLPTEQNPINIPRALEARAALPVQQPLPPRGSYSDGFYQPMVCSSRFGAHITATRALQLIYDERLNALDQIYFHEASDYGSGISLPYVIAHIMDQDAPFAVINRNSVPLQYPMIEQAHNLQILLFRMMLHCVIDNGGLGGQSSLLSGVTVTLYGTAKSDDEQSEPGSEESERGDPADLFPMFVPGARAHTGSRQGAMPPMQGGY